VLGSQYSRERIDESMAVWCHAVFDLKKGLGLDKNPDVVYNHCGKGDTMSNVERMALWHVVDRQSADPKWFKPYYQCMTQMNSGGWDEALWLLDCVVAPHSQESEHYDIYDAFCFAQILDSLLSRQVICNEIETGSWPFKDKGEEENNEVLNNLPPPFRGKFWGGLKGEDGYVAWDRPIGNEKVMIDPSQIPLEVGNFDSAKMFTYLGINRGFARWPYGYDRIYTFHVIDNKGWRVNRLALASCESCKRYSLLTSERL